MKRSSIKLVVIISALSFGACNSETEKTAVKMETVNETAAKESTTSNGTTSIKNIDKSAERTQMIKKRYIAQYHLIILHLEQDSYLVVKWS